MARDQKRRTQDDPKEPGPGFGRGRPLTAEEKEEIARKQAELIRTGKTRKGQIVLNTPLRRGIFIAGLVGIVLLAMIVASAT